MSAFTFAFFMLLASCHAYLLNNNHNNTCAYQFGFDLYNTTDIAGVHSVMLPDHSYIEFLLCPNATKAITSCGPDATACHISPSGQKTSLGLKDHFWFFQDYELDYRDNGHAHPIVDLAMYNPKEKSVIHLYMHCSQDPKEKFDIFAYDEVHDERASYYRVFVFTNSTAGCPTRQKTFHNAVADLHDPNCPISQPKHHHNKNFGAVEATEIPFTHEMNIDPPIVHYYIMAPLFGLAFFVTFFIALSCFMCCCSTKKNTQAQELSDIATDTDSEQGSAGVAVFPHQVPVFYAVPPPHPDRSGGVLNDRQKQIASDEHLARQLQQMEQES